MRRNYPYRYGCRHQIPALTAAGYRVWVPDQRGYNLSEKPREVVAYAVARFLAGKIPKPPLSEPHI